MTDFAVIEARPWHAGQMSRLLRHEHQKGLVSFGLNIHRELRHTFDQSAFRKAWLIDGQLAALGGIVGSEIESGGFIWLAISELARKYPVQMVKEAQKQLSLIMQTKNELACTLIPDDEAACRFAAFLGFHVGHEGRGRRAYSRFGRRDLVRYVRGNPDLRVTVGKGQVIPMGYHEETV